MALTPYKKRGGTIEERLEAAEGWLQRHSPGFGGGAAQVVTQRQAQAISDQTDAGTVQDAPPLDELEGDVEGAPDETVVVGLQTVPVSADAPTTGDLLGYDGAEWTHTAGALDGDVTGALNANTVVAIQNYAVRDIAPDDNDILTWVDADDRYEPRSGYRPYLLQGWVRNDVTAAPASLTEMPRWDGTVGNKLHGELPGTIYRLRGLRVLLDAPLNVNGSAYFCEVYIAGVATGFTREWIGHTAGADTVGTEGVGDVTVIQSGYITVYERVTGAPNAVRAQASVEIES